MQQREKLEIVFLKRAKQIVLAYFGKAFAFVFFAMLGTVAHHKLFPKFKAVSVLHVKTQQDSSLQNMVGRVSGFQLNPYSVEAPSVKYIKILKSEEFDGYVQQQLKLRSENDEEVKSLLSSYKIPSNENWVKNLAASIVGSASFKGNDDFIEIHSYGANLDQVVVSSRVMMDLSMKYIVSYERKEIEDAEVYLKTQQVEIQKRIDQMNEEIENLKGEKNLYDLGGNSGNFLSKSLQNLKEEEQVTKFKIDEILRNVKLLVNQLKSESINTGINSGVSANNQAMTSPNDQSKITGDSDQNINLDEVYKLLQSSRGRLPDKIRLLLEEYQLLINRKEAVSSRISKVVKSLNPKTEQKLLEYRRKIEVENSFYLQLQKQIFENRVYQISIDNRVRPYEIANYSNTGRETQLLYKLFVTFILVTVIFVLSVVVYLKMFPRIAYREDLTALGIKPIGEVPDMRSKRFGIKSLVGLGKNNSNEMKIHNPFIRSPVSMSFQNIGTRVLQALLKITKSKSGVISVLSQSSGDGKSVVAANIASYFAAYGFRTLLIHADWLKQQESHLLMEYAKGLGLSDYLANKVETFQDIIYPTKITNLSVINSGSFYHSFEVFKEAKYTEMIQSLRGQYEIIFVDTPALGAGIEGFELTSVADLNIVVARAHKTEMERTRELVENLRSHGCDNIYGILNSTESDNSSEGNYGQSYFVQTGAKSA